jgi:hypothetical protein
MIASLGTLHRVDPCLLLCDGHRPGGNGKPRSLKSRRDKGLWQFSHIRITGHEADHIDEVGLAAMEPDDLFRRDLMILRNIF